MSRDTYSGSVITGDVVCPCAVWYYSLHVRRDLTDLHSAEMAPGVRRKSPNSTSSPLWGKLHSLWQDKHMVPFKTEYTLLVVSVLWFLEIGINAWVIQKVACKLPSG